MKINDFSAALGGQALLRLLGMAVLSWPIATMAQNIQKLSVEPRYFGLNEPVPVQIRLDGVSAGCGVMLTDATGRAQRLLIEGGQLSVDLSFAADGKYLLHAEGKPMFKGYDLYWACGGQANAQVLVESKANRAKRIAAEHAAKKEAKARAEAEAARLAAEKAQREEDERAAGQREIERQKAALAAAARQRAMDLERSIAQAKAELEAARAEAKRLADQTPLDRIKALFASKEETPDATASAKPQSQ